MTSPSPQPVFSPSDSTAGGPDPIRDGSPGIRLATLPCLVTSAEPSVVFASLAAHCVPSLCSGCRIDVVDGVHGRYSIANPARPAAAGGLERLLERAAESPQHVVRVPFSAPETPDDEAATDGTAWAEGFHGVATFVWDRRSVTHTDRELVTLLVDHAVRTVSWQRAERDARSAAATAAHLQIALRSSRHIGIAIGILMHSRKITEDRAVGLLTLASQRTNRKLRDIALDVTETGLLELGIADDPASGWHRPRPAVLPAARPSR